MSASDPALGEAVIALASAAGAAIMEIYRHDFDVVKKRDQSPLTEADLAAHRVIVAGLQRLTPQLPVLSEESATVAWSLRRGWRRYWLVDPLDGTREFIKRNDEFSVNIALIDEGVPIFAVVQAPVDGRIWHAWRGAPAYRRDHAGEQAIRVRQPAQWPLRVAVSRSHGDRRSAELLARIGDVEPIAQGSSLKFCRIAEGDLDLYPRLGPTSEWDSAAGQCVLEAAGGAVLSLSDGEALVYNRRESLLNSEFIALGDSALRWREWLPGQSDESV